MTKRTRFAITASLSVLALALPAAASAQSIDPEPGAQSVTDPAATEQADDAAEDIIVTGSLIRRPNDSSASPIVSVSDAALRETGAVNVVDALNQIPSFTTSGNGSTGGQGQGGRSTVNLHGLGSNRNLVLLDGRRLPVSDINGNVDINILPDAIIGGIDVITGGASAVYGSDAISGVVNFKTVRKLEGFRVDLLNGISERGDSYRFNGSVAFGSSFAEDRGNLVAAFSYAKADPVNGSTRPFFFDKTPSSFIGTGTFVPSATNAPSAAAVNGVFAGYGVTQAINPLLNLGFNDDRTLFVQTGAVNYRGPRSNQGYLIVGNNVRMPVGQQIQFQNALDRKTAFVKADYQLTPAVTLYGQFMYVDLTVQTESGGSLTQFGALTSVPVTNPFIPAALRTILASRPNPNAPFTWNGRYVGVPYKNFGEHYTIQQYLAGARGDFAPGWSYDLFASWDKSAHQLEIGNAVLKSRVQTLLNAADGGNSLCAGGFNPFGDANARSLSAACRDYITKTAFSQEDLTQTQVQGQINGRLFDLGAGPAQVAFVGAYRRNTYDYVPDSDLRAQNIESVIASAPATGAISVKEFAVQVDVPLLADRPFFKELGIGGAFRVSDYSVTGSVTSYEGDARWRPFQPLLIRGSYQRAVRAPNIGELFSPASGTQLVIGTPPASLGDPCDVRSTARRSIPCARRNPLRRTGHSAGGDRLIHLPHDRDGADDRRQSRPDARKGGHLQRRRGLRRAGQGVLRRPVDLRRLLQHQGQQRDLDGARPDRPVEVLQPRRQQPELRRGEQLLRADPARPERADQHGQHALSEHRRAAHRRHRGPGQLERADPVPGPDERVLRQRRRRLDASLRSPAAARHRVPRLYRRQQRRCAADERATPRDAGVEGAHLVRVPLGRRQHRRTLALSGQAGGRELGADPCDRAGGRPRLYDLGPVRHGQGRQVVRVPAGRQQPARQGTPLRRQLSERDRRRAL